MLQHNNEIPKNPDRVVIIGPNSFVGSCLLSSLHFLGIKTLGLSLKGVLESYNKLISSIDSTLHENDVVVMLSAITPNKAKSSFEDTFNENIKMAQIVCDVLSKKKCSQVIYFSSDSVYSYDNHMISEATIPEPQSHYGKMHLLREQMFQQIVQSSLLIFRSTQIYGIADPHNSYGPCRMLRSAIFEKKIFLFNKGYDTRDHIYINDVINLLILLLKYRSSGIINGVTGVSISFLNIALIIKRMLGSDISIMSNYNKNSITYRSFDTSVYGKILSKYKFISIEEGINEMYKEMVTIN